MWLFPGSCYFFKDGGVMAAPEGTHAPAGHPRTLSRPSGAGRGHQSHPQDSRRPEDNHITCTEMASLACGTAAGHHRPTQPATVSPGCVWRAGMARRPRDGPAEGQFWAQLYSCTARRVVCPFLGGIRLLFGELDALTPPDCSGVTYPRGLWGRFFVKLRKVT